MPRKVPRSVPFRRLILALVIVVVGCLQAWDSGLLEASAVVWILVLPGILVPGAAALVEESRGAIFVAVPVSAILLLGAVLISPTPLPALLMITLAGGALLVGNAWIEAKEDQERRDGTE
jgi:hypothetical protein